MAGTPLLSVSDARSKILAALHTVPAETVPLSRASGRVLAEDVIARRTQPPSDLSAMDGYAVRAADTTNVPARLKVTGEAPAGDAYDGTIAPGEAVRIFTGAPLPRGADAESPCMATHTPPCSSSTMSRRWMAPMVRRSTLP